MPDNSHMWLKADGEMTKRIRRKDWSETPLGPMQEWPISLRNHLNHILDSPFPAVICWGDDLIAIYNDAYQLLLGEKPDPLGQPFREIWSEARDVIDPFINNALEGESSYFEDFEFTLERYDEPEQAWFDFSFSPLRDETGSIVGILNTGLEETERRKVHELLHESEKKYRTLFESIDQGFCIIKMLFDEHGNPVDYRFLEVNPSFVNHTGIKNAEGKKRSELGPLEDSWYEIYGEVALTRKPIRFEKAAKAMDRFYDVYAFPYRKREHTIAVLFQDITERKETRQALHESENRLHLAAQAADLHLCEVDLIDGTFEWTDNVAHKVNFPMPETLDEAEALLHPDDKKDVVEVLNRIAKKTGDFEIEYRVIDPVSQEYVWVYSAGTAIVEMDSASAHIVSVTKNITERKRAEMRDQFLMKLDNKLHTIGDPDDIMDTAVRLLGEHLGVDRCTYAKIGENEDTLTVMGDYSSGDIPDMERESIIPVFSTEARRLMYQNKPLVVDDINKDHRITKDDEAFFKQNQIEAIIRVPLHKDGKFVAKMGIHQQQPRQWLEEEVELVKSVTNDCWEAIQRARITRKLQKMNETLEERIEERTKALKKNRDQLRSLALELNKAEENERQRLASELHSNLGQLLAVGKMRVDTLKKMKLSDKVTDEVVNIAELMDDALKYTRELMSELKPPPALDKENFTKVLIWVAQKMEKHGLYVTVEDGGQPERLDKKVRTVLRRCVGELLYNIVKHADTNEGRIIVSHDTNSVQVTVEDQGKGFNIKQEPKPDEQGGFGLLNIHERINWLGGRFDIISEPGDGTRATILAPLEIQSQTNLETEKELHTDTEQTSANLFTQTELWEQIRVLLVDDHEMMRKGLRKMIEAEEDMTIIAEASNGEEAVKLAKRYSPDVIVMDVNLPDMDGIEATQKITSAKQDIYIIGLSLYDDERVARDMKDAGASYYLTKTEAFESLCATIRRRGDMT